MKNRLAVLCCMLVVMGMSSGALGSDNPETEILVLCYHSVLPKVPSGDAMSVSQQQLGMQMEYLKTHDFTPVSVNTILEAVKGRQKLPPNPVLLSFDDAYQSFYHVVFPLLQKYGFPAMLAVVGTWIEGNPPEGLAEPLMSWDQIKELSQSNLVEVASHSFDLHRAVPYNPAGNVGAVMSVPAYFPAEDRYETEDEYRKKIDRDFQRQNSLFPEKIGIRPRVMVWPYGRYNAIGIETAQKYGFRMGFSLVDGIASITNPQHMNRLLMGNMPIDRFIHLLRQASHRPYPIRAMQVDLDLIHDPGSYEQTDKNLGKLIDRLVALKVNTVYLQAFSDKEGTGTISHVYFDNRVLPVKADIFSHAVHQMIIRGFMVYAWMPTLSIRFPDAAFTAQWRVRSSKGGEVRFAESWYERLTPFSPEVRERIGDLYESLSARSQIHGILFQDDAYLAEEEDHHPAALAAFSESIGKPVTSEEIAADSRLADRWTAFKTEKLIEWTQSLSDRVRKYRPEAVFARNLYARVLRQPHAEFWFAQSYDRFLEAYDQVVVMAYPQMENAENPTEWLKELAEKAAGHPGGPDKTIFKLQAYDWQERQWVDSGLLLREMKALLSAGGRHIAYYPDNLWENRPLIDVIQYEMSTRTSKDVTGDYNGTGIPSY